MQRTESAAVRTEVVHVPLGRGPATGDLLRGLVRAGADAVVALTGDWAGGSDLVTSDPVGRAAEVADLARLPHVPGADPDVVGGGWFGALGYTGRPRFAFHDHVLRRRPDGEWTFEALWTSTRAGALTAALARARSLVAAAPSAVPGWTIGPFTGPTAADHLRAVEAAIGRIRAGEIYQVNVCTRLTAPFAGSAVDLFAVAAGRLTPAYGAFLASTAADPVALVGLSPELFLRRRGRSVLSRPIKGTRARCGVAGADDRAACIGLRRSAKDAAENVMIVDLLRNDLGRVCVTGSVRPSALLEVEPHPGVWHLVSSVVGELAAGLTDSDLLDACFPPGSVTGAPKIAAVAAIADLEPADRGLYTGAVGFVSPCWGSEFAVTIRSFEVHRDRIELGVGGGITADSVPMAEWREVEHKAAPLLAAIGAPARPVPVAEPTADQLAGGLVETVLVDDGVPQRLADHLARLDRSCRELYGFGVDGYARAHAAAARTVGRVALRITVTPDGLLAVTTAAIDEPPPPRPAVVVARTPGLWRHKWADRSGLAAVEASCALAMPLFVTGDGTVLETSRGNVFLLHADGRLVTPPLRDDLLPGVTRRAILDRAQDDGRPAEVRPFEVGEMLTAAAFWTSSLSGSVPITAVDGLLLRREDDAIRRLVGGAERVLTA